MANDPKQIVDPKPSSIRVVELAELETEYPVQTEQRKWVSYGEYNSYPDFLFELFLYSPTNSAVINATSQMIAGGGVSIDEQLYPLAATELNNLLNHEAIVKTAFNLKTFGYAVWVVTTTSKVVAVDVQDSVKWLSGIKDEDGKVNEWWFSNNWTERRSKSKPVAYTMFKPYTKNIKEVIVIKLPLLGFDYYPPVDYTGGVASIHLEAEIAEFHLSGIQSGLYPASVINFNNGIPPLEEQDKIEKNVKKKFSGAGNAGKFVLSFNDNRDSRTTIDTLEISDIDKQYEFLSKETTTKIMLSHRVTSPLLFGIRGETGLGNNAEELKDSYILYYETVIKPFQQLIDKAIRAVLYKNNLSADVVWSEYMPFMKEKSVENVGLSTTETPLTETERIKLLGKMSLKTIDVTKMTILSDIPFDGSSPAANGFKKLYKFNRIDKNDNNVLFKVLASEVKMYDFETIKAFPKMKGFYWSEVTFKK